MKKLSLRARLPLLVAGTMLPLILFAAGVIYFNHVRARDAAFDHVLESVRGTRIALDAEMQGLLLALQVLGGSQALQRDDFEGFRRNVEVFLRRFPAGESSVALFNRAGRQVFNSSVPDTTSLAPRVNTAAHDHVFGTGQPYFSNLFVGSVSRKRIMAISAPVTRDGELIYELSFNPPFDMFQNMIERQRPSPAWTLSIFDRDGVNFARIPNPETTIGERASPTLYSEMFKAQEAKVNTVSLEGVPLLTAYSRSPLSGWTVAAGISGAIINAPLWRNLAITAGIGAVLLAIGLTFALGMARQIARAEGLQRLLINELNHRVKNTLSTVQSIASQTFRETNDPSEARRKFDARLSALGRTHDVLSNEKWEKAGVREIVEEVIEPYVTKDATRLRLLGPDVAVAPRTALMLSMVLHELATNATKYGALSNGDGKIFIEWMPEMVGSVDSLRLTWRETGGPPVQAGERKGFGSRLIEDGFPRQLGGTATLDWDAAGVTCTLRCPRGENAAN
jgi:two-component sensor histidine kinase